ncbi:hypothetical protein, partial [Hymenobacter agri]
MGYSTAFAVLNLTQEPLTTVVGYTAVYYHWADGLAPFRVAQGLVVGDLASRPGFEWQQLPLTANSIKLTETAKESRHGELYQVKLLGERAQAPAHLLGAIAAMVRRPV